jgi:hypothetical protein
MHLRDSVCTTGHGLLTTLTLPDTDGSTLDSVLTTESTGVLGMLGDFHLLNGLSERGTITGTVFTGDSDLLSALSLCDDNKFQYIDVL